MAHPVGKVERIKVLRSASAALRGATERWATKYADKKHYDKQAFAFSHRSDCSRAFAVPALSFEAYTGVYGSSSVSTSWSVDQGVITQYIAQALNIHKQAIFDTIAQLAEREAASLIGEAQAELDAISAMLADVAASVIAARSDETPQAVQPEGQVSGAQSADAQPTAQPSPPSD